MTMTAADTITVYTTPTCPWCVRAKEFLSQQGVPFEVRDVSVDRAAADEMVRRTRQMGVPVIADQAEAIVGFDLPRLQKMAARHRSAGLGLRVKDTEDDSGAYVGSVRPDSPAQRAGLQAGDVVDELSGIPVRTASDLERIGRQRRPGQPTSVTVRRGSEKKTQIIPA
jgi:glutaredoxin-like YruB-family protein